MMAKKKKGTDPRHAAADRHFRIGWWALFIFASLGLFLESLYGLRVAWYVDVASDTRRHMFTLAHAHGTLLALVNIVFGLSMRSQLTAAMQNPKLPSMCLLAATILLPAGFFVGGLVIYDGDPGLGIMLVPVGALALIVGSLLVARSLQQD